jgi:hypothetical protein
LRFFQGREVELSKLNSWLADDAVSMIGIRGEGGIGVEKQREDERQEFADLSYTTPYCPLYPSAA